LSNVNLTGRINQDVNVISHEKKDNIPAPATGLEPIPKPESLMKNGSHVYGQVQAQQGDLDAQRLLSSLSRIPPQLRDAVMAIIRLADVKAPVDKQLLL